MKGCTGQVGTLLSGEEGRRVMIRLHFAFVTLLALNFVVFPVFG